MDPLSVAASQIGLNESTAGAAIQEYLANGGVNMDPAVTAWCAAFVNSTLAQTGQQGTGSNMARSFLDWGQAVDEPQRGDLAVFSRGDPNGPFGHVGFFEGYNPDGSLRILGGNQSDGVNIGTYSADELLGFRRGQTAPAGNALAAPQGQPQQQTNALAAPEPERLNLGRLDANAFARPTQGYTVQPITYQRRA